MSETKASFAPELFEPDRVAYVNNMERYLQHLKEMDEMDAKELAQKNLVQIGLIKKES